MSRRLSLRLALALLATLVLVTGLPLALVTAGRMLYHNGNYAAARQLWQFASYTSFYDRDVILLDAGNARYQMHDYQAAVGYYERAADIASDDIICNITYNWGRTLSDWGDSLATSNKRTALEKYADALRTIAINRCTSDPQYKDTFEALRQHLLRQIIELLKLNQQQQTQNDQQSSGDSAQKILNDHTQEESQQRQFRNQEQYQERSQSGSSDNTDEIVR